MAAVQRVSGSRVSARSRSEAIMEAYTDIAPLDGLRPGKPLCFPLGPSSYCLSKPTTATGSRTEYVQSLAMAHQPPAVPFEVRRRSLLCFHSWHALCVISGWADAATFTCFLCTPQCPTQVIIRVVLMFGYLVTVSMFSLCRTRIGSRLGSRRGLATPGPVEVTFKLLHIYLCGY